MKKKFVINHKHFPVNSLVIIAMIFTLIANTFGLPYMAARYNKTIWLHAGIK